MPGSPDQPIVVPAVPPSLTLKDVLRRELGQPHRKLERLIQAGNVRIDGKVCRDPGYRPAPGSAISLGSASGGEQAGGPGPRSPVRGPGFVTVLEDRDLIAVSKAPGVVVIPTRRAGSQGREDTTDIPLVARVGAALRSAGRRADPLWVIHRIDRETSGLVVFARTRSAYGRLRSDFRRHSPNRVYLAWTRGRPEPPEGRLQHLLTEDPDTHRVEVAPPGSRAKLAVLEYQTVATGALADGTPLARVRVTLTTGRRNQIRAQLAHEGWPLLGDRWYGAEASEPLARAALHAWRLEFDHPTRRGERLSLEAPLPDDLLALDGLLS